MDLYPCQPRVCSPRSFCRTLIDRSPSWRDSFKRRRMRPRSSGTVGRSVSSSYSRSVSAPAVLEPRSSPFSFRSFTSFLRRLCMGRATSTVLHVVVGVLRPVGEILGLGAHDPVFLRRDGGLLLKREE